MLLGGGNWVARLALVAIAAATGIVLAPRLKTGIAVHDLRHPAIVALLVPACVAVFLTFVDAVLFRAILPHTYVASIEDTSTLQRIAYYLMRGFNEEILYRLFLGTVFACVLGKIWRGGISIMAAMVLAQTVNAVVGFWWVSDEPLTPFVIAYGVLRIVVPGTIWGYLYWRHGLLTSLTAHLTSHVFLQPMLTWSIG